MAGTLKAFVLFSSILGPLTSAWGFKGRARVIEPARQDHTFVAMTQATLDALELQRFKHVFTPAEMDARISELLGWYGVMESQPSVDTARLCALIVKGLRRGEYKSLVLGESHDIAAEKDAAREIIAAVAKAGPPVGAYIHEQNSDADTAPLQARGVPILTYQHMFKPDADVKEALRKASGKLLLSYSGVAHTAQAPKNYMQNTLLLGLQDGYGPGRKDMPTVADSLDRPLVVGMLEEAAPLYVIEVLLLRELVNESPDLSSLQLALSQLQLAFVRRAEGLPRRKEPIVFVRDPRQKNFYLGISPGRWGGAQIGDRRPVRLITAAKILALPELAAWLGSTRVTSVTTMESFDGTQRVFIVKVRAKGLPDFTRNFTQDDVYSTMGTIRVKDFNSFAPAPR